MIACHFQPNRWVRLRARAALAARLPGMTFFDSNLPQIVATPAMPA
jgi:hypothetical protein